MDDPLLTVLLAPILVSQGLYTRLKTPKLPEPEGARSGCIGSGQNLSLLILGDSAAAGVGVNTQERALSGQLTKALKSDFQVEWQLLAETGRSTGDTAEFLKAFPDQTESRQVVVISLGVNDVTSLCSTSKWLENVEALVLQVKSVFAPKLILFSSVPPMGYFPALPQPLRWFLGRRANRFNRKVKPYLERHAECRFVNVELPLTADYIASDGFHPSAKSYSLWSEHIKRQIKSSFT